MPTAAPPWTSTSCCTATRVRHPRGRPAPTVGSPARRRRTARVAPGADRSRPPARHRRRDRAARDAAVARAGARASIPVTALFDVADDSVRGLLRGRRRPRGCRMAVPRGRPRPTRRGPAIPRTHRRRHLRLHGRRGDDARPVAPLPPPRAGPARRAGRGERVLEARNRQPRPPRAPGPRRSRTSRSAALHTARRG